MDEASGLLPQSIGPSAQQPKPGTDIDRLWATLAATQSQLAAAEEEAAASRMALDMMRNSSSWRATAPLRGLAERFPTATRRLRETVERHPGQFRRAAWLLRNAWRILGMRSPLPWAGSPPEREPEPEADPVPVPVAPDRRIDPAQWLFIGDSPDSTTTADLLTAAWAGDPVIAWYPVVATDGGASLAPYRPEPPADTSAQTPALWTSLEAIPSTPMEPQAGDHVLFADEIPAPVYAVLFPTLRERGIRFSVLIHDIMAIERPDLVSRKRRSEFTAWLHAVMVDADVIFVPGAPTRDRLIAWCIAEDLFPRRPIGLTAHGGGAQGGTANSWKGASLAIADTIRQPPVAERVSPLPLPRIDMPFARLRLIAGQWCGNGHPDVSILIVNNDDSRQTIGCVRHVWANTTGIRYEILIADNGSAPTQLDLLRPLGDMGPGVRVLPLGTNRYFGEANNIIAEQASGSLICLLSNDVFVSPGWLQALCLALRDNAKAGAVGPLLVSWTSNETRDSGGRISESGFPEALAEGEPVDTIDTIKPSKVEYLSAAAMVLYRDVFLEAGGFDLAYEPARYEDVDLCFQIAALDREIWLCPHVTVIQLDTPSAADTTGPTAGDISLARLNNGKFLSRWGNYLSSRETADLRAAGAGLPRYRMLSPRPAATDRRRAMIFTPYMLTPGGGERYLLTLALALVQDHDVTVVTPHPYSRLRLRNLGREFGIDLSACATATTSELDALPPFDLMVSMGNLITPLISARAPLSLYHCQFPFAIAEGDALNRDWLNGYSRIIVNSAYTRRHVVDALAQNGLPPLAVDIIHPPVPQLDGDARHKKLMILTVGRFFVGGHVKRHELLIQAFRTLHGIHAGTLEFHLAGSTMPRPEDIDYIDQLRDMSKDLPVFIHANCPPATLASLYRDAAFYWHGTGLATDLDQYPERAEHFGIAIVEAMSAQCVAFAFNAGGPAEIISDGVDGFLYDDLESLVARTLEILSPDCSDQRIRIGQAAGSRAKAFTEADFIKRVRTACMMERLISPPAHPRI